MWVASEIIKEDTPKARATKIGTFVEVAKQLKQLFSYNMLHAFIVGKFCFRTSLESSSCLFLSLRISFPLSSLKI